MSQASTLAAKATENVLRAANLSSNAAQSLKVQFERSAQGSAAGWHGANDIQTLSGLEGRFLWAEDLFAIRTISFTFDPGTIGFQGRYNLSTGFMVVEEGIFHCVPNNPAIGFAAITLVPASGAATRTFRVTGMFTDPEWRIYVAMLDKLGQNGPVPMMSMTRIA
jgi:hypothetical protein